MNLLDYRESVFSQLGEDGIIRHIFHDARLGLKNHVCCEFGAGDGTRTNSNTAALINDGWTSLQIEVDPEKYFSLQDYHKDNDRVMCLNKLVGLKRNTIDHLLTQCGFPVDMDFISIDIDGDDWRIWDSMVIYRPRVVLIEFNPSFGSHISYVQPEGASIGNSLLALGQLGNMKGYQLVCATEWNAFFVLNELYQDLGMPFYPSLQERIAALWAHPECLTVVACGYDGTLVPVGNNVLPWAGKKIDFKVWQEQIQVIPQSERKYGNLGAK